MIGSQISDFLVDIAPSPGAPLGQILKEIELRGPEGFHPKVLQKTKDLDILPVPEIKGPSSGRKMCRREIRDLNLLIRGLS